MSLPIPGDAVAAGPVPKGDDLVVRVQRLERLFAEQQRQTLGNTSITDGRLTISGLGGIVVHDADGDETLFIGGHGDPIYNRPDGQPQQMVLIRDDNDQLRFGIYDPFPLAADGYVQNVYMRDAFGNIVFVTDNAGGLAEPWIPVVMYPKFRATTDTFSYMTIDNGLIHTEKQIWEGRLPMITHPRLQLEGVFGIGSGTSSTPVYSLKVGGIVLDSWSQAALTVTRRDPVDLSPYLNSQWIQIELTVQATTGTGAQIAAQVLGCSLRQS